MGVGTGADFMLQGTINSIVDSYKKEKVVYYQIDLELTNLETNEVVWMGDKKIKNRSAIGHFNEVFPLSLIFYNVSGGMGMCYLVSAYYGLSGSCWER